jgi:hypothetical protein
MEGLERLHQGFLNEILRLRAIALEPHRMTKQPVDVRDGFSLKHEPATIRFGVGGHGVLTAEVEIDCAHLRWPCRRLQLGRATTPLKASAQRSLTPRVACSCRRSTDRQSRQDVTLFHAAGPRHGQTPAEVSALL